MVTEAEVMLRNSLPPTLPAHLSAYLSFYSIYPVCNELTNLHSNTYSIYFGDDYKTAVLLLQDCLHLKKFG
jgi:hypothetical protein